MKLNSTFKRTSILGLCFLAVSAAFGQASPSEQASFELGSGLNLQFNDGDYKFNLGGMIQPNFGFEIDGDADPDYILNARRSYLNFSGEAVQEKVDFFIQLDFSLNEPLLDAWVAYHPIKNVSIAVGQKQTIANNREMLFMEDQLQFANRTLLSSQFSNTGREFGLFVNWKFGPEKFVVMPRIAVTSGDGRNSFGADSRDVDLGGLKYAARLDIYPLGEFSEGNDKCVPDLLGEESPKILIGAAASLNDGASGITGEGHGDFFIYNAIGLPQLPDYRQLYGDILVKYRGFSLLGEYVVATAASLESTFVDPTALNPLVPTEISEYLALGTSFNGTLGYVSKSGYGIDASYAQVAPEFEFNPNSIVGELSAVTLGLSRYLKGNALKIQASISQISDDFDNNFTRGDLIFQLRF